MSVLSFRAPAPDTEKGPKPPRAMIEELVRKYARLVKSVVRKVGGAAAAAHGDDVEQRVFLEIWKQVSRERTIEHPTSYIYRAAVRETVRLLKQERRHELPEETGQAVAQATEPQIEDPQERLRFRETAARVQEVIEALSPDRRKAVRAHLSGFNVREIMELEDWSYNRARNLIARGMADLRRTLRELGIDG